MRQQPTISWASALAASTRFDAMLFKFAMNEDCQAALRRHKGLAGNKLGLNKDLMPTQQAHKSELWSLFKEAKATSKHAF